MKILSPALAVLLLAGCSGPPRPGSADREVALDMPAATPRPSPAPTATPAATPAPSPAAAELPADQLFVADLHGDGRPELFVGSGAVLRWGEWPAGAAAPTLTGRHAASGSLQSWVVEDFDGDGRQEVVAAFGLGRGAPTAPLEIVRIRAEGSAVVSTPLWRHSGPRNQAPSLGVWPRQGGGFDVYVAAFSDRFLVRGGVLSRDGGEPAWLPDHTVRMGMARAVGDFDGDGVPEVAVGRLYGDDPDQDGDLRVLGPGGRVEPVPTLRGVRAVGAGDLDGDGRPELLFGDGWHKNYGRLGRYRPSVASRGADGAWTVRLVEESDSQYAVERIAVRSGRLVAGGNRSVTVYGRDGDGFTRLGELPTSPYGAWAWLPGGRLVAGGAAPRELALGE